MKASAARSDTYVALLRAINLGPKNKLPMAKLVDMFAEAGCNKVQTYIQSGNVVFSASPACAKRLATVIERRISADFGYSVPVVLRAGVELVDVATRNPFLKAGADAATLHVAFLADVPAPTVVARLDAKRSPGDSFAVRGRNVYLHLPNGVARSKLTNQYFESILQTPMTVRNWRTVLKLVELTKPSGNE